MAADAKALWREGKAVFFDVMPYTPKPAGLPAGTIWREQVRKDIPDPAPGTAEAMAWHIEAVRHNWIGEFFPARQPIRREAIRVSA